MFKSTQEVTVELKASRTQELVWKNEGRAFELVYFEVFITGGDPWMILFSSLSIEDRPLWHSTAKVPYVLNKIFVEPTDINKGEVFRLKVHNHGAACSLSIKPVGDPVLLG